MVLPRRCGRAQDGPPRHFGAAPLLCCLQRVGPGDTGREPIARQTGHEVAEIREELTQRLCQHAVRCHAVDEFTPRQEAPAEDQLAGPAQVVGQRRRRARVGDDRVHGERGGIADRVRRPRDCGREKDARSQVGRLRPLGLALLDVQPAVDEVAKRTRPVAHRVGASRDGGCGLVGECDGRCRSG